MRYFWGISLLCLVLSGCSVGMALSGKDNPNLSKIKVGMPREEVLEILGPPKQTDYDMERRNDYYEIVLNNKPSAFRALGHAMADILTLGLWEIIGTSKEASIPERQKILIEYNRLDKVSLIHYP